MNGCTQERIIIGDKSVFYAWTDDQDPAKSNYDTLINYLSFSETRVILPPKEYDEIKESLKENEEKQKTFEGHFKKGDMIGEGNTNTEDDLLSLVDYFQTQQSKIYAVSKNWAADGGQYSNRYSQGFTATLDKNKLLFRLTIDELAKILTVEEPTFYQYMHEKYYSGTY